MVLVSSGLSTSIHSGSPEPPATCTSTMYLDIGPTEASGRCHVSWISESERAWARRCRGAGGPEEMGVGRQCSDGSRVCGSGVRSTLAVFPALWTPKREPTRQPSPFPAGLFRSIRLPSPQTSAFLCSPYGPGLPGIPDLPSMLGLPVPHTLCSPKSHVLLVHHILPKTLNLHMNPGLPIFPSSRMLLGAHLSLATNIRHLTSSLWSCLSVVLLPPYAHVFDTSCVLSVPMHSPVTSCVPCPPSSGTHNSLSGYSIPLGGRSTRAGGEAGPRRVQW